ARTKVSWVPSSAAASSRSRSPRNLRTPGASRSKITRNASASPARARDSSSSSDCVTAVRATSTRSDVEGTAVSTSRKHCYVSGMDTVVRSGDGLLQEIEITLSGDLDEAQRKRLLEIADKCPVHRTLTKEVHIVTRLIS